MKNLKPLTSEEVVKYIKICYKNTSLEVYKNYPLFFGEINEKPNILLSFSKTVPNNDVKYDAGKRQHYLVENLNQVIEILKLLDIYQDLAYNDLKSAYNKIVGNEQNRAYLNVTSFKPLNFN